MAEDVTHPTERLEAVALEPCPFCGGETIFSAVEMSGNSRHNVGCKTPWCRGSVTLHRTRGEAIAAWNRRAYAEQITGLERRVEELTEGLRPFAEAIGSRKYPSLTDEGERNSRFTWDDFRRARALLAGGLKDG